MQLLSLILHYVDDGEDPGQHGQPSLDDIAAFDDEMQHELIGSERPGVRSRFHHDLSSFQNTRLQLGVGLTSIPPPSQSIPYLHLLSIMQLMKYPN